MRLRNPDPDIVIQEPCAGTRRSTVHIGSSQTWASYKTGSVTAMGEVLAANSQRTPSPVPSPMNRTSRMR